MLPRTRYGYKTGNGFAVVKPNSGTDCGRVVKKLQIAIIIIVFVVAYHYQFMVVKFIEQNYYKLAAVVGEEAQSKSQPTIRQRIIIMHVLLLQ